MAIVFNCPHCHLEYRLKDELAGRTATCRNQTCRQKIVIPKPTVSDDTPPPDVEAAALAALSDEPAKAEKPAERVIDVECLHCGHKWTEPQARAGKNTLCPECRQRVKIPELKEDELPGDWRQKRTKLPSLAKEQHEQPDDVQDAGKAVMVSGTALKEADATGVELEPRPLKQKVLFVAVPLLALAGIVFGIWSWVTSRTEDREHTLMVDAQEEFKQTIAPLPPSEAPAEAPLCTAVLHVAAGEYALRQNTPEKLKEAMDHFARARDALREASRRPQPSPAWIAVGGELAVAQLGLGGTDEQVKEQLRIRWVPDPGQRVRPNERVFTVLEELRQTLQLMQGAEFEFRSHLARRLARELTRRGQAAFAVDQVPLALFPQEPDEAKAIAALEVFRADRNSDVPRRAAEELRGRSAELQKGNPRAASAMTLFLVLNVENPPTLVGPPTDRPSDGSRFAHAGRLLLEGKAGEALELARRPGAPDQQLRALVLCADWSPDPGPALDAALAVISVKKKDGPALSPFATLRLAQVASSAGRHDQANRFADSLADEGLKVWAKGDAVRLRAAASPNERADEAWVEPPKDLKTLRAGHGWGRLWVARQNTRLSGDRGAEVKAVSPWPTGLTPFGKAGVALGLQDRDQ